MNTLNLNKIESYMSPCHIYTNPQSSCESAVTLMRDHGIHHLPVVSQGKIVGILSERDLRALALVDKSNQFKVVDLMNMEPYVVPEYETLYNVVRELNSKKIGCAIVQNILGEVKGIFTASDALRLLENILANHTLPGEKGL